MRYWYIAGAGLRASQEHPDDVAFEISASLYTFCLNNFSLVNIGMKDGRLTVSLDTEAYRKHALASFENADHVIIGGVLVFDSEVVFISPGEYTRSGQLCDFTQLTHIKAVQARNREYATKRMLIQHAKTVEQIDSILVGKSDD